MADFKQALEWLKEGKKVKSNTFENGAYIENENGNFYICIPGEERIFLFGSGYLNQEWEIFGEKK